MKTLNKLLFFFLLLFAAQGWSQTGEAPVTNYTEEQLGVGSAVIWRGVQDPASGVLYMANNAGVLVYDGKYWNLIATPTPVRSLAVDDKGKVWVGCISDFGSIEVNAAGRLSFVSLKKFLPENSRKSYFGWITDVILTGGKVYFVSDEFIFRAHYLDEKKIQIHIYPPMGSFAGAALVGSEVWVYMNSEKQPGLYKLNNTTYDFLSLSGQYPDFAIRRGVKVDGTTTIVLSEDYNLWKFSASGIQKLNAAALPRPLDDVAVLGGDRLAVATRNNGAFVIKTTGETLKAYDVTTGVGSNATYSVFADNQNGVWIGHSKGISRASNQTNIASYERFASLLGKINSAAFHNGVVYLATNTGVYKMVGGQPERVGGIKEESYALAGVGGRLLAATFSGLKDITADAAMSIELKPKEAQPLNIVASKISENTVWVAHSSGVMALKYNGGQWQSASDVPVLNVQANSVVENADGSLWIGTDVKGVCRWKPGGKPEYFEAEEGFFDGIAQVYALPNGEPVFRSPGNGYYVYAGGKFVRSQALSAAAQDVKTFAQAHLVRDRWVFFKEKGMVSVKVAGAEQVMRDESSQLFAFDKQATAIAASEDKTFVGLHDVLYEIRGDFTATAEAKPQVFIRRIKFANDSSLMELGFGKGANQYLLHQPENEIDEIGYEFNSLHIEFASPSFEFEKANEYQYWLEGMNDNWSLWSRNAAVDFTGLSEGKYKLHVRARNAFGRVGPETVYKFIVKPPLYRHWSAFIIYAILLGGLVWLFVRLNAKRLEKRNKELEGKVEERTAELAKANVDLTRLNQDVAKANENLSSVNKIIAEQNQDLLDSINYASRIQQALLPSKDLINHFYPDNFILFRPRDIVSGDFFWFSRKGNLLAIAAADCTGHGVPGAFMSVMGMNFLSQLMLEKTNPQPDEILQDLDVVIRKTLKQDTGEGKTLDGMDIALAIINLENNVLTFAGAQRPITIYHNNTLEVYKGSKASIGGTEQDPFERVQIQLQKGDAVYLYSDGYQDQFGGDQNRKMTQKRMLSFIEDSISLSMERQKAVLEKELDEWKKDVQQTDDVLVMGFRV